MEKYLTMEEAIRYLMNEHNAGDYLVCEMIKKFYGDTHHLENKEEINKWLEEFVK